MSFLSNWSDLHVHEYAQLEISSKCYIRAANSSTLCKFHERRKGLQPMERNADHCWFARDVTATMWCVGGQEKKKQKHFSPFGTKPYFHRKSFEKKFYCNDHQHGRFFSRGWKPRITVDVPYVPAYLINQRRFPFIQCLVSIIVGNFQ